MPVQDRKKQRREDQQRRVLLSPSTTRSTGEAVSQDHSVLAIANLVGQGCLTDNNTTTSANDNIGPAAASPNRQELESPGENLFKKPGVHSDESPKELEAKGIGRKERHDPISYWAAYQTWPEDFAEHNPMASSNSTNKRQRTSDSKQETSLSYSQSRKVGEVPEQYTAAYETHVLAKGLDMDYLKGEDFASKESKKTCANFLRINIKTIRLTTIPQDKIGRVIHDCRNRNEAMVNREITPLIIPSLRHLYYGGANDLEHVVDEINAGWYDQCMLEGPRLRPDLAVGLFPSAFTELELEKLKRYRSVDNWTQVTSQMFFPFLMCEVKCGRGGLDVADRQNMHSCSVAVRAVLRIEQEADKYRPEKKLESLNGQVLVFSVSHDQEDARLYGHYARVQGEKWSYYHYRIRKFDLTVYDDLLAIYNFVQNILKFHLPTHVQRLKDAVAALPEPDKAPESDALASSSGLSFATSEVTLNDDGDEASRQDSEQRRDADGFLVPPRPANLQGGRAKGREQGDQLAQFRQLLEEQRKEAQQREWRLLEEAKQRLEEAKQRELWLAEEAKQRELRLVQILEEAKQRELRLAEEAKQRDEEAKQRESRLVEMIEELSNGSPSNGSRG